jgi:hypothetical protein
LNLELTPALIVSPGSPVGLGPRFDAFVNVRLQPIDHVSFSVFALAPLLQSPVRATAGSADVRTLAMGGSADLQLPLAAWELSAGAGAAALLTWVHGSSSAAYMARNSTLRTAAAIARIGLSWQLTDRIRLSSRLLIGLALPAIRVEFLQTRVASWGQPFVMGAIGVELALPWER